MSVTWLLSVTCLLSVTRLLSVTWLLSVTVGYLVTRSVTFGCLVSVG